MADAAEQSRGKPVGPGQPADPMVGSTETQAAPRDLLRIGDLNPMQVRHLLDLAAAMKERPLGFRKSQAGRTVACWTATASPRIRVPLEAAAWRLGMLPVSVPSEEMEGGGQSTAGMAAELSGFVEAIAVQTSAQTELERIAESASVPVMNVGTDQHHPCQALADLLTLREHFGELSGLHQTYLGDGMNVAELTSLRVAYVGGASNVARSLMEAAALAGMKLLIASPPGQEPAAQVLAAAAEEADARGGCVRVVDDPAEAATGADAVYTDAWAGPDWLDEVGAFRVDTELMARAKPGAVFMHRFASHPCPEVSEEVMDGPQSVALQQAANLMPVEQAVLQSLLSRLRPT